MTWGATDGRGDSSPVQDQLKNVQQIQALRTAFVAILANGSIVTWGPDNSGAVQETFDPFGGVSVPLLFQVYTSCIPKPYKIVGYDPLIRG